MQAESNHNEYRNLPLVQLQESPTNPRKRFNEATLKELAASFETRGVLQPLVVREKEEGSYEVIAGARRFRAAQIAQLESVPVRVVALSDAAAIETQVIENLQREDIHPLEEALGFRSLLDIQEGAYTVQTIAAKAGKSEAYVLGRIKLTELIPSVAEAFLADRITIGHALLIAKLPAGQQQEAFNAAFRQMWMNEGNTQVLIPVKELAAWIESNILLELAAAPFSKEDAALLPEAGACVNCPKRTGFHALLFTEVRKDSCTDPQCFRAKVDAHVEQAIERKPNLVQISSALNNREGAPLGRNRYIELEVKKQKSNGKAAKEPVSKFQQPCEKMAEAMVMDGGKRGQVVKVCADPNCRVHCADKPKPEDRERERMEERKRIEKEKLAITIRHRILAAILERVGVPLKRADLQTIVQNTIAHLSYDLTAKLAKRHKADEKDTTSPQQYLLKQIAKYDEAGLCRILLEAALLSLVSQTSEAANDVLLSAARRYRVDTDKLQKAVTQEFATKRKKQQQKRAADKNAT